MPTTPACRCMALPREGRMSAIRATEPTLHIRLLGAFQVRVGERVVDPATWRLRKAAAIVKLLALESSRQLHDEQLMEQLWPEFDPDAAANNFRRALHIARRTLEPGGDGGPAWLVRQGDLLVLGP